MTKHFYSKETNGFYTDTIHGGNMPSDCVLITDDEYNSVKGQTLKSGANGKPVITKIELTEEELIKQKINALECQITDRRIREALLDKDDGFLLDIECKIIALREKL